MSSVFVSRETTRDALVALFDANPIWAAVYGYVPKSSSRKNVQPFLTVTSFGTDQEMLGESFSPTFYTFLCASFVLMDDGADWHEDDAEDKIDEIDKIFRQIIRDNTSGNAFAHSVNFAESKSITAYTKLNGVSYRVEEWLIVTDAKNTHA